MGKRRARRSIDNDYFDEPDYDQYSDEELDELYQFGEIRSARPQVKLVKKVAKSVLYDRRSRSPGNALEGDLMDGLELDLDGAPEDDWIYDDDTDVLFDDP